MNILEYISLGENEKPLDRIVTDGGFCSIFRTIACIGDSLSSGEFESKDENGNTRYHDFYDYSWGQFIARNMGSKVYNFSRGGMNAKSYIEDFSIVNNFWSNDKLCQAYIIALGVNDIIYSDEVALGEVSDVVLTNYQNNAKTFAGYYAQIIQRVQAMQPRAKIFLVTIPRENDERDEKRRAHRDLLQKFSEIFENTYLIDLFEYAPVYDAKFKETFFLGHMTPTGYVLTARMIESYIDFIIRKNPQDFSQVGFIGTDLSFTKKVAE